MADIVLDEVFNEYCKAQIKLHEGFRQQVYLDIMNIPTGGYGHAFQLGSALPKDVWESIFEYDYSQARDKTNDLIWQRNYQDLSPARKAVLCNMIFNMGMGGVLKFQKTLAALDKREFELVSKLMLQSKWASQVGNRARDLAKQMATGTWIGISVSS